MEAEDLSIAPKTLHVPRITQIDSEYLDNEVILLLKSKLSSAFTYTGQNTLVQLGPELEVAMKLFLHHYTTGKHYQTVGQQLLQVKYAETISPKRIKCYFVCLILSSWLKQRLPYLASYIQNNNFKSSLLKLSDCFETTYQILDILNLLLFLVKGKYPSVMERLFSMKVHSCSENRVRQISYAYFTRELLWNGFADLLATTLPLIPTKQFHNIICQFLPNMFTPASIEEKEETSSKIETICTICNESAILPQKFGCSHVSCYYCIHSTIAITSYRCPLCGVRADDSSDITPVLL